jgi:hypothetical protein
VNDDLAGSFLGERGFFGKRLAADGERGTVGVAGFNEALGQHARAAGGLIVGSYILAAGVRSQINGVRLLITSKSSMDNSMPISRAMAIR